MAEVIVKMPDHLVETFCSWFSNQGEQDFFEVHSGGIWDPVKMKYVEARTYIGTRGYGIDEPIEIVEYDKETDEEIRT